MGALGTEPLSGAKRSRRARSEAEGVRSEANPHQRNVGVDAPVDPRGSKGNGSLGDGPLVRSEAEPKGRLGARPHGGGTENKKPPDQLTN